MYGSLRAPKFINIINNVSKGIDMNTLEERVIELERLVEELSHRQNITTFTDLHDTPDSLSPRKYLMVDNSGRYLILADYENHIHFTDLVDSPINYEGHANQLLVVDNLEKGLTFVDMPHIEDNSSLENRIADNEDSIVYVKNDITVLDSSISKINDRLDNLEAHFCQ